MSEAKIGGIYRHYKGQLYRVIAIVEHGGDDSSAVIYANVDTDKVWYRSVDDFESQMPSSDERGTVDRFELID